MVTINPASISTEQATGNIFGRVSFLATRPQVGLVNTEQRTPGSLYCYYDGTTGFAELYIVDTTGYKFYGLT